MRGTPADEERLLRLEDAIDRLREAAETGTVVVEGARDLSALDWLGIGGHHVTVHHGAPLAGLVEELASCPVPIVLLVDWDRTGGTLARRLGEGLAGRVAVDVDCRRRLAGATRARTLEELPSELTALRRAVHGAGRP
ncbi:MAG: hypothetical protein AABY18_02610 [Candidatus Thermoplasmatota archaeon]